VKVFSTQSVSFKLSIFLLLASIILFSVIGYVYVKKQQSDDLAQTQQTLHLRSAEISEFINSKLAHHQQHSTMLANLFQSLSSNSADEKAWQQVSSNFANTILAGFVYGDSGQRFWSPANWPFPEDLVYQGQSRITLDDKLQQNNWGTLYFDESYQEWLLPYWSDIYLHGEMVVWGTVLKVDDIIKQAKQQFLPEGLELFVYDQKYRLITHPDYGPKLLRNMGALNAESGSEGLIRTGLLEFIKLPKEPGRVYQFDDWSNDIYAVAEPIEQNDWTVIVYSKDNFIFKDTGQDAQNVSALLMAVSVLIALISLFLARKLISVRLNQVNNFISDGHAGKLDFNKRINGSDEIDDIKRQLIAMFENFSGRLKAKDKDAEKLRVELDENKALAQAVSYSDNAVLILDLSFNISFADAQALSLLNCERDDLLTSRFFSHIHQHMAFVTDQIVNDVRRKESWHGELALKEAQTEREIWVNTTITPLRNDAGHVTKYVASMQDISFIKDSQHQIEKLAYTDELTSLANRSFFVAQLEKFIEMKKRGHFEFAVLHFDIDDFKKVNDKLGYDGGDLLLMELAARLQKELRGEDVLARLGGDEFAFIVVAADSEQSALSKVKSILNTVASPFNILGENINISTSIGISMSNSDDPNLLLQHADLAMYEAKAKGKNTFHFFTKELNDVVQERMMMEQKLRIAIERDGLELFYQPKIDINLNTIIGYEALLRWQDPELGFVSPEKFIPVAEQSNLIVLLGQWVMEQSIKFIKDNPLKLPVSINLSGREFEQGDCAQRLNALITKYDVDPSLIEIEITESYLMADVEDAIRQLQETKDLGANISIDDFGTGYSSLSYLKRLPVDTLKIDRSFIKDIPDDINDVEITGAIIAMAQKLGLKVIAEGVETQEQVAFLRDNGCYLVQGYYYSKPLPAKQAKGWQYPDHIAAEESA
jgi:diguanylate cyclase (GGDEF)-like protein/PAS domain S-box-containing protein